MIILDARVEKFKEYDNTPSLKILVDKIPNRNDLEYTHRDCIYYAELDGYVSFFYYFRPDDGYGGRTFNLKMKDGSTKSLIGPWSSNSASVNKIFGPCVEVSITDDLNVWHRGYTFTGAAITLDKFKIACNIANATLAIDKYGFYIPMPKCEVCEKQKTNKVRTKNGRKYLCKRCEKKEEFNRYSFEINEYF